MSGGSDPSEKGISLGESRRPCSQKLRDIVPCPSLAVQLQFNTFSL
jgi:hypothetical protein